MEREIDRTPRRRGSDRGVFLVVAIVFVVAVGASVVVGFVGSAHTGFDWELASIFGTAVGTTLLAASTGWLAWSTRSEVRATQDLAELTRRQYAASERPVVLVSSVGFAGEPSNGVVQVSLYNAGLGPALRVTVSVRYFGHNDWQPVIEPHPVVPVIPSDESVTVQLNARFPAPQTPKDVVSDRFLVSGKYLDRTMHNEYDIIATWPTAKEAAASRSGHGIA